MGELGKEFKGFDKAMNEVLIPIVNETKENIDSILKNDPVLKKEIEEKVANILKERKNKKIKEYEIKISLTKKTVKRNKLIKYLNEFKKISN